LLAVTYEPPLLLFSCVEMRRMSEGGGQQNLHMMNEYPTSIDILAETLDCCKLKGWYITSSLEFWIKKCSIFNWIILYL